MKKNISINLQGIIFHIEEDGYEVLSRYLAEVKAHFARFRGHDDIVADIEGRMAEIFGLRLSPTKQVITLADVEEMQAKMGRVRDFADVETDEDDEAEFAAASAAGAANGYATAAAAPPTYATATGAAAATDAEPRKLYRDTRHGKLAGVAAGLGQYFKVSPVWLRLGFLALLFAPALVEMLSFDTIDGDHFGRLSGLSVLLYLALWVVLPKRNDAPEPVAELSGSGPWAGRKLYRDVDTGKVGGVASGLAHYFQTDVVLVRVLFLIGLIAAGSTFLIYLILWVAVPVARTVSEKLQMRGDDVTLAGIANSLDAEGQPLGAANARPVGRFLEGAARGATPVLNFVGAVIRWGAAAFLVVMGVSSLVSIGGLLGAALGVLPAESVIHIGDNGQAANSIVRLVPTWGAVAAFLAFFIPTLSLFFLAYRLVFRRPLLGRTANLVLLGLWILSVTGAALAGTHIASQFQESGTAEQSTPLRATRARSLTLAVRERNEYLNDVRLRFAPADSGTAGSVDVKFRAHGPTTQAARLTAGATAGYDFEQRPDSVLSLDEGIALKPGAPFRGQEATVTLRLPVDKTYLLTPEFIEWLRDEDFTTNYEPRDHNAHRARFTPQGRFECLDCPPVPKGEGNENDGNARDEDDRDGDEVVNLNINGEKMRIRVNTDGDSAGVRVETEPKFRTDPGHYGNGRRRFDDLGDFDEIQASGAYRVVVRRGDAHQVEAAGRDGDLNQLRVEVRNGTLRIRRRDRTGFLPHFNFNERPVLVTVTLPRLVHLDLSGACRADVAGLGRGNGELQVEESGACTARVVGLDGGRVKLDLNGASSVTLAGRADDLEADGSGVCQVNALGLQVNNADFDLSGASHAKVRVENTLRADLSGSSRVEYAGNPERVEKDVSGGSSVRKI